MKALRFLSVLAAALALSSPVLAQSANKNVTVTATLTSVCRFVNSTDLTIAMGTYAAFRATDLVTSGTVGVECTRGATVPTLMFGTSATAVGLVNDLTYGLATSYSQTSAGASPNGTDIGSLGSARTGDVTVTATIPAGQAGGVTAAAVAQVLTVSF